MRFKNSFESMELHFDFLTVLDGRPPQCQLENSKFEIESLDSIFDTTYSMYRLLPTIYLAAVSKQSCSNARTLPVKQIVCRSFISRDVTELTELVQLSFGLIQLTNRPLASEEALEVIAYVCGSVTIAVQKDHALLVLATAQSSDLFPSLQYPFFVDLYAWSTSAKTLAARLRCVRLRCWTHDEMSCQLSHEPYSNARRIALVARHPCSSCD